VLKIGMAGRVPHDLRRSATRNLVRAANSGQAAMTLTGHLTRSVFDRYNITDEADLRNSVVRLAQFHETSTVSPSVDEKQEDAATTTANDRKVS
jgi:hypothetical protein